MRNVVFVFWENRPAIIDGPRAFAILAPGQDWTEVRSEEVGDSGYVMSEEDWRARFRPHFGNLDMPDLLPGITLL